MYAYIIYRSVFSNPQNHIEKSGAKVNVVKKNRENDVVFLKKCIFATDLLLKGSLEKDGSSLSEILFYLRKKY